MVEPELDAVAATLYTPLYARAHAAELVPKAGVFDSAAAELLARSGRAGVGVLRDRGNVAGAVWRTAIFDRLTVEFCQAHPRALVVSVGIGLCTRRERLGAVVSDSIDWIGVDVPPVIELRRRESADSVTRLLAASLGEAGWADQIDPAGRPVLVLAEGVLMYLNAEQLAAFMAGTRRQFGTGTQLLADYFHPRAALSGRHPIVKATGAQFCSGARDGRALADLAAGWTLLAEHDVMSWISPIHRAAALAFRILSGGGRLYSVAQLVAI